MERGKQKEQLSSSLMSSGPPIKCTPTKEIFIVMFQNIFYFHKGLMKIDVCKTSRAKHSMCSGVMTSAVEHGMWLRGCVL